MSSSATAPENACPSCLAPSRRPCVTATGRPTRTHAPRARGEWPKILCIHRIKMGERFGGICGFCGHTSFVHPGAPNPSLSECIICRMERATEAVERIPS